MSDPRGSLPSPAERPQKRAAGGVVATWTRLVVITLVGIAQAPILFGYVPAPQLGVWYLLFALATFLSLSDFGLPSTFQRAVSYSCRRGLRQPQGVAPEIPPIYATASLAELYASALVATVLMSLAVAAVSFPAALVYFTRAVPADPLQGRLAFPLALFLVGAVLNQIAAISGAGVSGAGNVTLDNAIRTIASAVGFALIWILVPVYRSLTTLCGIYVVQGLVAALGSHLALARHRSMGRIRDMRLSLPLIRVMYRESAPIFVSRLGAWLTVEWTLLIAGRLMGPARIPDLAILRQVIAIGASVTSAIPIAVSPHVAGAYAAGYGDKVLSLYLGALRYSFIVNVLWTIGLLLWAPTVIGLLVGPEHFLGYGVLVPLALASFLDLHAQTHAFFVWNLGRWPFAPYVVAGGVLNVVLATAGCALFGFVGLAWGTLAAQGLTVHWAPVVYALRRIGVTARTYVKETITPALAYATGVGLSGAAVRAAAAHLLSTGAGTSGRLAAAAYAVAAIVVTTLLAGVFAWTFALTEGDRSYFLRLARIRR